MGAETQIPSPRIYAHIMAKCYQPDPIHVYSQITRSATRVISAWGKVPPAPTVFFAGQDRKTVAGYEGALKGKRAALVGFCHSTPETLPMKHP